MFKRLKSAKGATMIEYALIASLIAVTTIGALKMLGKNVFNGLYMKVADHITPNNN